MYVQVFSNPEVEIWDPFPHWSVSFLCLPGLISSPRRSRPTSVLPPAWCNNQQMFYPKTTTSTLTYCFGHEKFRQSLCHHPLSCVSSVWGMEKWWRKCQIRSKTTICSQILTQNVSTKKEAWDHQNILMLFWYQHDPKVKHSPEFEYLIPHHACAREAYYVLL